MKSQLKNLEKIHKIKTLFVIFLSLLYSCNNDKKQELTNNIDQKCHMDTIVKEALIKQLKEGAGGICEVYPSYDITDLQATVILTNDLLINNQYQKLSQDQFSRKIEELFSRTINWNSNSGILSINMKRFCDKEFIIEDNIEERKYIYVSKEYKTITNLYPIPTLIDYTKYPDIAKLEEEKIIIYDAIEDSNIELIQWKDILDLEKEREKNINTLIHRNKYLFNESKASLTWLKFNDTGFLESLVKTFGYVDDKDLLQWVINRTLTDKNNKGEDYNSLFFMKNCSNQFVLHKATFDVLKEKIDSTSIAALQNYINNRERNQELQNLTFAQKAQVLAYTLYIGEFFAQQEQYSDRFAFKFMGPFYEYEDQRDKYDEEFKKNNYYNLPDFEQLWNDGKEYGDGIGLPM